jgi:predicted TIM-barrel fold metal-dependent hydrolase
LGAVLREDNPVIVDAHCHLGADLGPLGLLRVLNRSGVDQAVILPEAAEPPVNRLGRQSARTGAGGFDGALPRVSVKFLLSTLAPLARFQYASVVQGGMVRCGDGWWRRIQSRPDNGPVAEILAGDPDRFIGLAFVNPRDPGHLDVLDRCFAQGFRGIKVHAWLHDVDLRHDLRKAAERCGDAGFPVMVHLGGTYRTGLSILDLADRLPTTAFIVAHAGLPYYSALWQATRTYPNLYFDLSGPFMSAELVRLTARHVPPGRLIFASGGPSYLRRADGECDYSEVMGWVDSLGLSREPRRAIFGETLLRLVGLGQARGGVTPRRTLIPGGS